MVFFKVYPCKIKISNQIKVKNACVVQSFYLITFSQLDQEGNKKRRNTLPLCKIKLSIFS